MRIFRALLLSILFLTIQIAHAAIPAIPPGPPGLQGVVNSSGNTTGIVNAQGNPFLLQNTAPRTVVIGGDSTVAFNNAVVNITSASATSNIATLGTIVGGSSYSNGTYTGVPLVGTYTISGSTTGGTTGTGAVATIVVSGGAVTSVTLTNTGATYAIGDSLTAAVANIGGTGSGFTVPVATIGTTYGTLVKINYPAHSLGPGQRCEVNSFNQIEWNGVWNTASIVDYNNFSLNLSVASTVAQPTGSGQLARGNTYGSAGWFTYLTRYNLKLLNNAGLGGDTANSGVAGVTAPGFFTRLPKDVYSYNPQLTMYEININDISNGTFTATQVATATQAIVADTLKRNIPVVLMATPPVLPSGQGVPSGYGNYSYANSQKIMAVNAADRTWCMSQPGCWWAETFASKVNAASMNSDSNVNTTIDGLHPSPKGSYLDAVNVLGPIFNSMGIPQITLNSSNLDSYAVNTTSTNVINNPLFKGTGGSLGSGATGTIIATLGSITGGTLYTPTSGTATYKNVPLTGGTGTGAVADIVVTNGAVSAVTFAYGTASSSSNYNMTASYGTGYVAADTLSAAASTIGGTGSGFSVPVATVGIPSSWRVEHTGSATSTITAPPRTLISDGDTIGNNIVVTTTSATTSDSVTMRSFVSYSSPLFSAGQWLYADCDIGWSNATNLKNLYLYISLVAGGNTYTSYWGSITSTGTASLDVSDFPQAYRGPVRVPPLYVPTPVTGAITGFALNEVANFNGVGGVTMQAGRCQLRQSATLSEIN